MIKINKTKKQKRTSMKKVGIRLQDLITRVGNLENGVLKLKEFIVSDLLSIRSNKEKIQEVLYEMKTLTRSGYVNDPHIDIPLLYEFLRSQDLFAKVVKGSQNEKVHVLKNLSICINTLYFNLVLLLFYYWVCCMLKAPLFSSEETEDGSDYVGDYSSDLSDLKADLETLREYLFRMINPEFVERLRNRGFQILCNSVVGFDSEYEEESSLENRNELLSIQLAGNVTILFKVPYLHVDGMEEMDLVRLSGNCTRDERVMFEVAQRSINEVLMDIRLLLYKEQDLFIGKVCSNLEEKGVEKYRSGNYWVYKMRETVEETLIRFVGSYSSTDLFSDCENILGIPTDPIREIVVMLNTLQGDEATISKKMSSSIEGSREKAVSRLTYRFNGERVNISVVRNLYLCMHESCADLSMLEDFVTFKEQLSIVGRSFVTLGKPLEIPGCINRVHVRDTILIAPVGAKSLSSVGKIYGPEFHKIDLGDYRKGNMKRLLSEDKEKFIEYAKQDSRITLKHANTMSDFNMTVGRCGVPLTISGLGRAYVLDAWEKEGYKGYQVRKDLKISEFEKLITPKGTRAVELSKYLVGYVASYRGGRNESFLYGVGKLSGGEQWIDYDLTSCYTTVMTLLGHPMYDRVCYAKVSEVSKKENEYFVLNYIAMEVQFSFPVNVKYPCIATRVDENSDIYPLKGVSIITGPEYLAARSMGCEIVILWCIEIPFKRPSSVELDSLSKQKHEVSVIEKYLLKGRGPYGRIVKGLQGLRRVHAKKTFHNYMYKEIGNSIYGQVAMGISGKTSFDIKSSDYVRVPGNVLSNPILATYITGFVRALVGECLYNISKMGGTVASVTTDGWITDLDNLEERLLALDGNAAYLFKIFREARKYLTMDELEVHYDDRGLEVKNVESEGLISWKTRGQFGFSDGGISAATGFQARFLDKEFLIPEFGRIMEGENRVIEYIQTGLRSATDIYQKGGHVVVKYNDKSFSLEYDNKRCIIKGSKDLKVPKRLETVKGLLDTKPWGCVDDYVKIRSIREMVNIPVYSAVVRTSQSKSYQSSLETGVRSFIKICYSNDSVRYGLPLKSFSSYGSLLEFLTGYGPCKEIRISVNSISKLVNRNCISRAVPRNTENEGFVEYVRGRFKEFNVDLFFRELSGDIIRARKKAAMRGK